MNTLYIDVCNKKMCCYCGKEILGKRKDYEQYPQYQCNCTKALKQIELHKITKQLEHVFELDVDWSQVKKYKKEFKKSIK